MLSPQYHVVYDNQLSTVSHLRDLSVPPNRDKLVKNSSELVTTEKIDLTKTWFEGQYDITADTVSQILSNNINDPLSYLHGINEKLQDYTTPNEGSWI